MFSVIPGSNRCADCIFLTLFVAGTTCYFTSISSKNGGPLDTSDSAKLLDFAAELPMPCLQEHAEPQFCLPDTEARTQVKMFLRSCRWADAKDFMQLTGHHIMPDGVHMTGSNPYDDVSGKDEVPLPSAAFTGQSCAGENGLAAIRIGPFNTTGGYHWTEIMAQIHSPEQIFVKASPRGFAFQSYAVASMTESGELIGHPPLHQHHYHFWAFGDHPTDVMNIHGEQQCKEMEGGVDCYIKTLPNGFAYVASKAPIIIRMAFNDVRADHSPSLESWVLAAVKALHPGNRFRQVSMMRIELRPLPMSSWSSRQTYNISIAVDSVTWDSGTLDDFHGYQVGPNDFAGLYPGIPKDATIIEGSLHAHDNLMWDVMFFQGTPDRVFHNLTLAAPSMHRTEYGDHSISRMFLNIRARMLLPDRATLAYSFRTAQGLETVEVSGLHQSFVRLPRCNIDPLERSWVLISLHHNFGNYHTQKYHGATDKYLQWRHTARMHAYVRVYYAVSELFSEVEKKGKH